MLITFYNIFRRFYYLHVIIKEVIESLTLKFGLNFSFKFLFLFADILNYDVFIVIDVLQDHLVTLQIFIKYRLLFFFIEIIIEGDDLRPIFTLPFLFLFHFVSHADLAGPCSEAFVFFVKV